jgi:hypothetical protein
MSLLYQSEYFDSVVSSEVASTPQFTLVAGTHTNDFPYWGDEPLDNVLLRVADERLEQTLRSQTLVRLRLGRAAERSGA